MVGQVPLFTLSRDGFDEITIFGEISVVRGEEVLFQSGEVTGAYPFRSLLKPWQFLATGVELDARHVPALGSISATPEQLEQLKIWYPSPVPDLILPPSNACFSKHVSILEACAREGWDPKRYREATHPYHERVIAALKPFLGCRVERRPTVTDGCGLRSPVLTTIEMARLYGQLVASDPKTPQGKVRDAMMRSPEWIGGPGRVDTRLMQENAGRVIAKEGADGLLGIGILPDGIGILLKLGAGYLPALSAIAIAPILEDFGLKTVHTIPPGQSVRYHYRHPARLIDVSPLVHPGIAVWPGDVPYHRHVSLDTHEGSHLTLSSIEATVHVGAHTDAVNHFEKVRAGIESADLKKYAGPCQVIEVKKQRGELISSADLVAVDVRAKRVLFKTGSFPDPDHFNEDFVAFSGEVIEDLAKRGVVLVGIDTPSIDSCHSKELPAHHATARAGMAILEGIVLEGVAPGFYDLTSLPLRLDGADASPVRAVLKPLQ